MEENTLNDLLRKIHIDTYYYDEYDELVTRSFEDVIGDLAEAWEALNDDYKDELYVAMGIIPSKPKSSISYPVGIKEPFKQPNPMKITYGKDTGIEYLQNQPTSCEVK